MSKDIQEEANLVRNLKAKKDQNHVKSKEGRMVFTKPTISIHTKPLFLRTHVNDRPLGSVLVYNRSIVNVIPLKTLIDLTKIEDDIIATNLLVITVIGEAIRTLGVIPLQVTVGIKK